MNLFRTTIALSFALAFSACRRPLVVTAAVPDGCTTQLLATPAHPYLAEFDRKIKVTCAGTTTTLELERDSGGLGRVELVRLDANNLAITDAFQSAVIRPGQAAVVEDGLHEGKLDHYASPCARTQLFERRHGQYLGAFDYCDHQWVFLPPLSPSLPAPPSSPGT